MRVTIPDDLADELQVRLSAGRTLDQDITERLQQVAGARRPYVVLDADDLREVGALLGFDRPLLTREALLQALTLVASVHIGRIQVAWTPAQLRLIEERATRTGLTLPEFLGQVVSRVVLEVFQVEPTTHAAGHVVTRDRIWTADQALDGPLSAPVLEVIPT